MPIGLPKDVVDPADCGEPPGRWTGRDWLMAAASAVGIVVLGSISGLSNTQAIRDWYPTLVKPSWSPPTWLFGPVWTILYALMGVALWRVIRLGMSRPRVQFAVGLFAVQLLLNLIWTPVFFGARSIGGALVVIALLWLMIDAMIMAFWRLDRPSALMLAPYLIWVSFASALTFAIWKLNTL